MWPDSKPTDSQTWRGSQQAIVGFEDTSAKTAATEKIKIGSEEMASSSVTLRRQRKAKTAVLLFRLTAAAKHIVPDKPKSYNLRR